jgi:hypothetical protein
MIRTIIEETMALGSIGLFLAVVIVWAAHLTGAL